ncbi:MAG: hypothetical protein R2770_15715 [Acidimicrobiales bacterium]
MRKNDGWIHYLTLVACAAVVGLFAFASMTGRGSASEIPAASGPSTLATPASTTTIDTPPLPTSPQARPGPVAVPSAGEPVQTDLISASDEGSEVSTDGPGDGSQPDAPQPETQETAPSTSQAPTTTSSPVEVSDEPSIPTPPAERFTPTVEVVALLEGAGGDDATATALEILSLSGPLGAYLAIEPLMASRLHATLDGARIVSSRDYADRIAGAVNSTLDSLAADHAQAGTGLCLVVGPGPACEQVADLNHTFSAMPHRPALDELFSQFGSQATVTALTPLADLHFTGNFWNLLREAHNTAITAELKNAWALAGADVYPDTEYITANMAFLSTYLMAARDERPDTWDRLAADGVGVQVGNTWSRLADAFVLTDSALWNIAYLHDDSAVRQLCGCQ